MFKHNLRYNITKIISFFTLPEDPKKNIQILKYVFFLFIGWRLALLFITFLGLGAIPNTNHYTKELFFPNNELDYWSRWGNWDGKAYQDIALFGYQPVLTVFFPAYSLLIKGIGLIGIPLFWAGFLISNVLTVLSMFFLFKLVLLDFNTKNAKRSVFALLIFPTSFYLVALYNESLILFTTLAAFYFARQKKWIIASILASIAASTRLVGVAVITGVFLEYLLREDIYLNDRPGISILWKTLTRRLFFYLLILITFFNFIISSNFVEKKLLIKGVLFTSVDLLRWPLYFLGIFLLYDLIKYFVKNIQFKKVFSKNLIFLIFSIVPVSLYLIYQKIFFGSFFIFYTQEIIWGKIFSQPWAGPVNSLQYLIVNLFNIGEYSSRVHLRFLLFTLSLVSLIISYYKLRVSYTLFFLIVFLIPLFSGSLIDFPRYSLIFFPVYIILSMIENEILQKTVILISVFLLTFLSILFFNSYFFM